jgi:hypothetical protein
MTLTEYSSKLIADFKDKRIMKKTHSLLKKNN